MLRCFLFFISLLLFPFGLNSKTAEEWKTRVIYELVTDRFARTDHDTAPCHDLSDYCGGTFKGIEQNLDYIEGLGANAIWISPIHKTVPKAYHGYGVQNFLEINPRFGTEQDLRDLIKACHDRDIWVMVDVVPNHVGYVQDERHKHEIQNNDYSEIVPFNKPEYFHEFEIECHEAEKKFPRDQKLLERCWLEYLPDLNQDHPFVRQFLLNWIKNLVKTYDIDGLRLDALRHIDKNFWLEFSQAAGVYTVGEVFDPDINYAANYQHYVDAVLNAPIQSNFINSYIYRKTLLHLQEGYKSAMALWPTIGLLGNFVENHDFPRFLSNTNNTEIYKAAVANMLSVIGIPILYYGGEQGFSGGDDPENREPLWGHMDTNSDIYQFISRLIKFRKKTEFCKCQQLERYADDSFYAFTRGYVFFAFSNDNTTAPREMTIHPYREGTVLCSVFNETDCVQVKDAKFTIDLGGQYFKILYAADDNSVEMADMKKQNNAIQDIDL